MRRNGADKSVMRYYHVIAGARQANDGTKKRLRALVFPFAGVLDGHELGHLFNFLQQKILRLRLQADEGNTAE